MLKIVTSAEMQVIDQAATQAHGLPGRVLMENAGQRLARLAETLTAPLERPRIAVLCGRGKNGGDGLICARYLAQARADVAVFMMASQIQNEEVRSNLQALKAAGVPLFQGIEASWPEMLNRADLIIDALLGIGLQGPPREPAVTLIKMINQSPALVLAADVPSGLNADNGGVNPATVAADFTLTFGLPKQGLLDPGAAPWVGQLTVEPIGFPEALLSAGENERSYMDQVAASRLMPKRAVNAHKKNTGKVAIIGGSGAYHGAVLLAARGALRVGSGHVTLAYPDKLNVIIREHALETLCVPLPCNRHCVLARRALDVMVSLSEDKDAVVIGPGMGWEKTTQQLIQAYIRRVKQPRAIVIDADALHALAEGPAPPLASGGPTLILTPHEGEASILLGCSPGEIHADRPGAARAIAERYGAIVVLKGQHTLVTAPDRPGTIIGSGTQALAVAGTGDVLGGMIGSLAAQKLPPWEAALLGSYLHGMAGSLISPDPLGMGARAGEIADAVPRAIAALRYHPKTYQTHWALDQAVPPAKIKSTKRKVKA